MTDNTRALLEQAQKYLNAGCAIWPTSSWHKAIRAELAKPPTPAWHDAPTCPGLWVLDDGTALVLESGTLPKAFDGLRWYGPIPQDTKAEGEST